MKRNGTQTAFPTFFDEFFTRDPFGWDSNREVFKTTPAVNIREQEDSWTIEVAAPGLLKEDFQLELDHDLLTISFERKEEKEEQGKFTRREFHYTSFKRSFTLPENAVNTEEVNATYNEGILTLTLPKLEEVKRKAKRAIEIG